MEQDRGDWSMIVGVGMIPNVEQAVSNQTRITEQVGVALIGIADKTTPINNDIVVNVPGGWEWSH